MRRIALPLALTLLSACASTYKAPGLPTGGDSAIAVLEPKVFHRGAKFFISRLDGQARGFGWFERFELAPGRREITASVNSYNLQGSDLTRYFTAEAGKKYHFVVHDDSANQRWSFSIVEQETGNRVDSAIR